MPEAIRDLVESVIETGSSKFKATVTCLELTGNAAGLAGVREIHVKDAQHVALLIAALFKAQATGLQDLNIHCREDGDCGCDKNAPHFGLCLGLATRHGSKLIYQCPKVRDLASLAQVGGGLRHLKLSGCRSVEVWPDFSTMTSLEGLDLSYTSLKEWPTVVQLFPFLTKLDIRGCRQLPAEEMIYKALGYTSVCNRELLASLLDDLRDHRRDRCSVVGALDSQWPQLIALFHQQWRNLRCRPLNKHGPITLSRGAELCYIIMIMYDLWFGEEEARSESEGPSPVMKKMRRLLCSESFMSLPFYAWRIGRTRRDAVDEWEELYPGPGEAYESYMALALIGAGSIGCFNASLTEDLKDRMVNFLQSFMEAPQIDQINAIPARRFRKFIFFEERHLELSTEARGRLAMRVGNAVCTMARAPSVAADWARTSSTSPWMVWKQVTMLYNLQEFTWKLGHPTFFTR